ncbi:hypothetical protein MA16_Dca018206 [Dendrobium catenatum]|uniref:Uncharacterized protein n=1 Tax=Dendrobium catenatum TaxID=906689 RepID=A0A2I0XB13_9ASPA|nr:hypothetical protein MA16_Dca018206 [Dendrobium catenatum]
MRTKKVPSAKQPLASAEPCVSVPVAKLPILEEGFVEANPGRITGEGFVRAMARCLPYYRSNYMWEDDSMIGSVKVCSSSMTL